MMKDDDVEQLTIENFKSILLELEEENSCEQAEIHIVKFLSKLREEKQQLTNTSEWRKCFEKSFTPHSNIKILNKYVIFTLALFVLFGDCDESVVSALYDKAFVDGTSTTTDSKLCLSLRQGGNGLLVGVSSRSKIESLASNSFKAFAKAFLCYQLCKFSIGGLAANLKQSRSFFYKSFEKKEEFDASDELEVAYRALCISIECDYLKSEGKPERAVELCLEQDSPQLAERYAREMEVTEIRHQMLFKIAVQTESKALYEELANQAKYGEASLWLLQQTTPANNVEYGAYIERLKDAISQTEMPVSDLKVFGAAIDRVQGYCVANPSLLGEAQSAKESLTVFVKAFIERLESDSNQAEFSCFLERYVLDTSFPDAEALTVVQFLKVLELADIPHKRRQDLETKTKQAKALKKLSSLDSLLVGLKDYRNSGSGEVAEQVERAIAQGDFDDQEKNKVCRVLSEHYRRYLIKTVNTNIKSFAYLLVYLESEASREEFDKNNYFEWLRKNLTSKFSSELQKYESKLSKAERFIIALEGCLDQFFENPSEIPSITVDSDVGELFREVVEFADSKGLPESALIKSFRRVKLIEQTRNNDVKIILQFFIRHIEDLSLKCLGELFNEVRREHWLIDNTKHDDKTLELIKVFLEKFLRHARKIFEKNNDTSFLSDNCFYRDTKIDESFADIVFGVSDFLNVVKEIEGFNTLRDHFFEQSFLCLDAKKLAGFLYQSREHYILDKGMLGALTQATLKRLEKFTSQSISDLRSSELEQRYSNILDIYFMLIVMLQFHYTDDERKIFLEKYPIESIVFDWENKSCKINLPNSKGSFKSRSIAKDPRLCFIASVFCCDSLQGTVQDEVKARAYLTSGANKKHKKESWSHRVCVLIEGLHLNEKESPVALVRWCQQSGDVTIAREVGFSKKATDAQKAFSEAVYADFSGDLKKVELFNQYAENLAMALSDEPQMVDQVYFEKSFVKIREFYEKNDSKQADLSLSFKAFVFAYANYCSVNLVRNVPEKLNCGLQRYLCDLSPLSGQSSPEAFLNSLGVLSKIKTIREKIGTNKFFRETKKLLASKEEQEEKREGKERQQENKFVRSLKSVIGVSPKLSNSEPVSYAQPIATLEERLKANCFDPAQRAEVHALLSSLYLKEDNFEQAVLHRFFALCDDAYRETQDTSSDLFYELKCFIYPGGEIPLEMSTVSPGVEQRPSSPEESVVLQEAEVIDLKNVEKEKKLKLLTSLNEILQSLDSSERSGDSFEEKVKQKRSEIPSQVGFNLISGLDNDVIETFLQQWKDSEFYTDFQDSTLAVATRKYAEDKQLGIEFSIAVSTVDMREMLDSLSSAPPVSVDLPKEGWAAQASASLQMVCRESKDASTQTSREPKDLAETIASLSLLLAKELASADEQRLGFDKAAPQA
jgi:hypothetical protein